MSRIKKYIRAFIVLGVVFGVVSSLPLILKYGLWFGIVGALIGSILWTTIMAAIFIPIDFMITRKLPAEALKVRQEMRITVKGSFDRVFEQSFKVLRDIDTIKTITPQEQLLNIYARTKPSIASFGENITLQFKSLNQESTEILITSCPIVRYTLLDFGKNFKNVELISKELLRVGQGNR